MKMYKYLFVLLTLFLININIVVAENYETLKVNKIMAFPDRFEGKKIALLDMKIEGEVEKYQNYYAVSVWSGWDVFLPGSTDKIVFMVTEDVAIELTDDLGPDQYYYCNILGTLKRVPRDSGPDPIVTTVFIEKLEIINRFGEMFKTME